MLLTYSRQLLITFLSFSRHQRFTMRTLLYCHPEFGEPVALDIETMGLKYTSNISEIAIYNATIKSLSIATLDSLTRHLHEHLVLGYNIMFDLKALAYTYSKQPHIRPPTLYACDVMHMVQSLIARASPCTLAEACTLFDIHLSTPFHQASTDAKATFLLFEKLVHHLPVSPLYIDLKRLQ